MDKHLQLRRAVVVATIAIGSSYSCNSNAIGLGDMHVRSYIGQPLLADLTVYGVNNQDNAACFHVKSGDTNTIHDVNFSLNRTSGGNAKLKIKSLTPVIEPIASLTIMNTCGTLFTRQYNLLIDPAPTTMANISFGLMTQKIDDANANIVTSQVPADKPNKKASTNKTKRNTSKASTAKKKRVVRAKRKTNKSTVASKPEPAETSTPRLTISGGKLIQANDHSMQLNLDKSINPNRPPEPLTFNDADFADEITVMQNRVSHLDKQLSKLSIQNAKLKQANTVQTQALNDATKENDFLRILAFCLGAALIASSYFFVDWLRRRNEKLKTEKEQALWHAMQAEQEEAEAQPTFEIDEAFKHDFNATQIEFIEPEAENVDSPLETEAQEVPKKDEDEDDLNLDAVSQDNIYKIQPSPTEIIEEETQVLDDAELFISHGRTSLAVEILQSHLLEHPKESASTWMYLLDLLVKEGMEKEYEIAAKECNKHFNISVAAFSEDSSKANDNTLESYERISAELQKRWGTPEAVIFLDELIFNTRIESRVGFSKEIFEELNLLREIAQDEIRLDNPEIQTNLEKETSLDLPKIEASDEFKDFGKKVKAENRPKEAEKEDESFEFELMDIGHR